MGSLLIGLDATMLVFDTGRRRNEWPCLFSCTGRLRFLPAPSLDVRDMSIEYKVQGDWLVITARIDISPDAIARAKVSSTGKTRITVPNEPVN